MNEQTPRQVVEELDKYIVGQDKAKRAVAVALRNRWRARHLSGSMKEEIIPKNILMIGATGVGKTEIARRLAKLVKAPFIKVEATKFTEVGYVGRDVESMVRDLVEISVRMIKQEKMAKVAEKAKEMAEERILDMLVPERKGKSLTPIGNLFDNDNKEQQATEEKPKYEAGREFCRKRLKTGALEKEILEIDVEDNSSPMVGMFAGAGMEDMTNNIQDMLGSILPKKHKKRKVSIAAARKIFQQEEAQKLIDMDEVAKEGIESAETNGIIFLDEIDKIAVKGGAAGGPDVSREGVQRDILPIVEGSTVVTKYGPVKTEHVLFIAAGAFHMAKPSDLIPELQGRFPIRVELTSLTHEDFRRILTEPENALIKQYAALLKTEGITIKFTDAAIDHLAQIACDVNAQTENIGARRLYTIMEKMLEDLSFEAPEMENKNITIDPPYIDDKLGEIVSNRDLSRFIL
ncbi:ATP-dependent protease ATPase subunit HslU [Pectinatus sottacetonis]|uniref:ATP-dependent protease ATPase subunit HslU n=1 Tax=Pectinatus sottacetonis TaxID=1002795 RepID=UPI0018C6960F|nr:ATP-dependent protease ATPase subunit HslU [Pectinatus sottacetonis]